MVAVVDRLDGEPGGFQETRDLARGILTDMAHVPEVAQFAELLEGIGDASAQKESCEARQRIDVGRREHQGRAGRQYAMDFAQDKRWIDAQMLEGFAEQGACERIILERQRRALDVAAANIEAELPDEIRNAVGIDVDPHHRISRQLQQSRHVAGRRSDLQNLACRSKGRDQLKIRQVSPFVIVEIVYMPLAGRAGPRRDGRP